MLRTLGKFLLGNVRNDSSPLVFGFIWLPGQYPRTHFHGRVHNGRIPGYGIIGLAVPINSVVTNQPICPSLILFASFPHFECLDGVLLFSPFWIEVNGVISSVQLNEAIAPGGG